MLHDIVWLIVTAVLSFIIGILLNTIKNKINKDRQEDSALKDGMRCLLRKDIIELCDQCSLRGHLRMEDLENIEDMYKAYTALGGNGIIVKLVDDTKKMKVI